LSYSIQISGHKDFPDEEQARAFEEGVQAKAEALVAELDGVTSATISGAHVGFHSLQPAE
jgi:hypothetical protein